MSFEQLHIKSYTYWDLYLHISQTYLGRVYLWAKRETAADMLEMLPAEQEEFFRVSRIVKHSLIDLFHPDLFNYVNLQNEASHLHIHIIPRYKTERRFHQSLFVDKNWGKNYVPYESPNLSFETYQDLINTIRAELNRLQK